MRGSCTSKCGDSTKAQCIKFHGILEMVPGNCSGVKATKTGMPLKCQVSRFSRLRSIAFTVSQSSTRNGARCCLSGVGRLLYAFLSVYWLNLLSSIIRFLRRFARRNLHYGDMKLSLLGGQSFRIPPGLLGQPVLHGLT